MRPSVIVFGLTGLVAAAPMNMQMAGDNKYIGYVPYSGYGPYGNYASAVEEEAAKMGMATETAKRDMMQSEKSNALPYVSYKPYVKYGSYPGKVEKEAKQMMEEGKAFFEVNDMEEYGS